MTKCLLLIVLLTFSGWTRAQLNGNTTPTYPELIAMYHKLAKEHQEIQLFNMGQSDYGLPIYLCVVNGGKDSLSTFEKARKETTILINNGIHPGEPDGINACLIWLDNWIKQGKKTNNLPVIAIIPTYNVGGAMNRSSSSRANQDGPAEYGFRGNAKNLDLNRDFIKMDSENAFTFARIFHGLNPDVFIDTHVSNGADYQYTLTYIASMKERMAPSMAKIVHEEMIPALGTALKRQNFPLIPYVDLKEDVPEKGMVVFNDLPRYAMGYAALFHAISFTIETHMLKPFPERTQATLKFLEETIRWTCDHKEGIEEARLKAVQFDQSLAYFNFNYSLTDEQDSLLFKGFEHSYPTSEVTGLQRLKYHRDKPFEKYIPFYNHYVAQDSVEIPEFYAIGRQNKEVIERLKANGVQFTDNFPREEVIQLKVVSFDSPQKPYEGHFLHTNTVIEARTKKGSDIVGEYVVLPTDQPNRRFILSVLEPEMEDSYFNWNFFDSYLQQKEYFSPYVFEDYALQMLQRDISLKMEFEEKKKNDSDFAKSTWAQLYYLYQRSKFYEPSHNVLPIYRMYEE